MSTLNLSSCIKKKKKEYTFINIAVPFVYSNNIYIEREATDNKSVN